MHAVCQPKVSVHTTNMLPKSCDTISFIHFCPAIWYLCDEKNRKTWQLYHIHVSDYLVHLAKYEFVSLHVNKQSLTAQKIYSICDQCPRYHYGLIKRVNEAGHDPRKHVEVPNFKNQTTIMVNYNDSKWNDIPECTQTAQNIKRFRKLVNTEDERCADEQSEQSES